MECSKDKRSAKCLRCSLWRCKKQQGQQQETTFGIVRHRSIRGRENPRLHECLCSTSAPTSSPDKAQGAARHRVESDCSIMAMWAKQAANLVGEDLFANLELQELRPPRLQHARTKSGSRCRSEAACQRAGARTKRCCARATPSARLTCPGGVNCQSRGSSDCPFSWDVPTGHPTGRTKGCC